MYNEESQLVDDFCSLIEQDSSPWEIEKYGKEFDYDRGRVDVIALDKDDNVIAFEMKLSKWKDALYQAFRSTSYAHKTYVILPRKTALNAIKFEEEFSNRCVGLCYIDDNQIITLIESTRQEPLLSALCDKVKITIRNQ